MVVTLNPLTLGLMDFPDFPSPLQQAVVQPPDRFLTDKLSPGQSLALCCRMPAGDFQEQPGVCGVVAKYASMLIIFTGKLESFRPRWFRFCVYACGLVCACARPYDCGGHKRTLGGLLRHFLHYSLQTGALPKLGTRLEASKSHLTIHLPQQQSHCGH